VTVIHEALLAACPLGGEQYVTTEIPGIGRRVVYEYRSPTNQSFACHALTLANARRQREAWFAVGARIASGAVMPAYIRQMLGKG